MLLLQWRVLLLKDCKKCDGMKYQKQQKMNQNDNQVRMIFLETIEFCVQYNKKRHMGIVWQCMLLCQNVMFLLCQQLKLHKLPFIVLKY